MHTMDVNCESTGCPLGIIMTWSLRPLTSNRHTVSIQWTIWTWPMDTMDVQCFHFVFPLDTLHCSLSICCSPSMDTLFTLRSLNVQCSLGKVDVRRSIGTMNTLWPMDTMNPMNTVNAVVVMWAEQLDVLQYTSRIPVLYIIKRSSPSSTELCVLLFQSIENFHWLTGCRGGEGVWKY